jgi:hypothetical protein
LKLSYQKWKGICRYGLLPTYQITVSQRQRAGRTGKANKKLVKIQTPMKLGTIFIGVLFYGTV